MKNAVLVVDDEKDFLKTYERLFLRRGYDVIAAGTCAEAIAAVRSGRTFDLIIADMKLPDGNGIDLVRVTRSIAVPPPVIVVTGFASDATQKDAIAAGATAYLSKPFSIATFTGLVDRVLGQWPAGGAA